jgi:hypothetical protein
MYDVYLVLVSTHTFLTMFIPYGISGAEFRHFS